MACYCNHPGNEAIQDIIVLYSTSNIVLLLTKSEHLVEKRNCLGMDMAIPNEAFIQVESQVSKCVRYWNKNIM